MPDVRVTIDGQEVTVPANSTVLDVAKVAGIDIPTLCAHPALEPIGACRVCLVEVEKQRALQPACTFPVSDGMVIHTKSEKAQNERKFVLQLLFSERNHFCMYCQMSGSCELQDLAYANGLDHWEYDRAFPKMPVDASRTYFVMDHNRCILCRRCVRACDELVGNATLGLKNRGADTMVVADMDVPFGQSTCVSCGTCLQVCPTGALMDRASAFMGAKAEVTRVKTTCTACSVGCGLELVMRGNRVIRVEGDWDASPNKGLTCEIGRFHLLNDRRAKVTKALVKEGDAMVAADLDAAMAKAAAGLKAAGDDMTTVLSGFVTNEEAKAAVGLPGAAVQLGTVPARSGSASLELIDEADLIIVADTDLAKDYQVAGFAVKRTVRHKGARMILLAEGENGLDNWASSKVAPADYQSVIDVCKGAQSPVIVYGPEGADLAISLKSLIAKATLIGFGSSGNARGIAQAGVKTMDGQELKAAYVVAGEMESVDEALMDALKAADFVVVQAAFAEPWSDVADVILPAQNMFEKAGTVVNAEGRTLEVVAASKSDALAVVDTIAQLAALMA